MRRRSVRTTSVVAVVDEIETPRHRRTRVAIFD
ncbi:putative NADH-flavin reductase [Micromonospora polyrhachis]|uniref:Putative NADH-flavin reductase n=1 Tax=Micromonospora polyrhachis TaxID=1282883 RepID=A0A7W7STD7_9ACTN|nr:putative NADH-flavin reductase [Micromonospora polyrhachis]